jgi:plasmid stabilization system protein ParE
MNRIVFRKEALEDLEAIIAWYDEIAPDVTTRILADIFHSVDQLTRYPRSGVQVPDRPFRRIVTLRYHFKIAYEVSDDQVIVLGIFRHQDRVS